MGFNNRGRLERPLGCLSAMVVARLRYAGRLMADAADIGDGTGLTDEMVRWIGVIDGL